jgi:hypothetical protein
MRQIWPELQTWASNLDILCCTNITIGSFQGASPQYVILESRLSFGEGHKSGSK